MGRRGFVRDGGGGFAAGLAGAGCGLCGEPQAQGDNRRQGVPVLTP